MIKSVESRDFWRPFRFGMGLLAMLILVRPALAAYARVDGPAPMSYITWMLFRGPMFDPTSEHSLLTATAARWRRARWLIRIGIPAVYDKAAIYRAIRREVERKRRFFMAPGCAGITE